MNPDPEEWNRWCELAMLCEGPLNNIGDSLDVGGGLCWSIICESPQEKRMLRNRPPHRPCDVFWWPHTRGGWGARASFCWRMAAQCEAEEYR